MQASRYCNSRKRREFFEISGIRYKPWPVVYMNGKEYPDEQSAIRDASAPKVDYILSSGALGEFLLDASYDIAPEFVDIVKNISVSAYNEI